MRDAQLRYYHHPGHKFLPFTSKLALAAGSLGGAQAVRVQNTEALRVPGPGQWRDRATATARAGTLSPRGIEGKSDQEGLASTRG